MSFPTLLNSVLRKRHASYPEATNDDFFEIFCADIVLVDFDLSNEEIESGIIDGANDGGVDAAYLFINRKLWAEDFEYSALKGPVDIELILIQSKNQDSFKEAPVDKLSSSLPMLLNPNSNLEHFESLFRAKIISTIRSFNQSIDELSGEFPNVSIRVYYCCKATEPNELTKEKANHLARQLSQWTPTSFEFLGCKELYERSAKQKKLVRELAILGAPLSGTNSYIALASLREYSKFLSGDDNKLLTQIFDANVRAYQGEIEVNKEIAKSLSDPSDDVDFWWLNNGVTIVADDAQFRSNRLTIENPLIVNGLQTSYEIFKFHDKLQEDDDRKILVRVIDENDRSRRDEIIRATNRQTGMKHSSFRSTEPIHKRIEDYFLDLDFYYDRRKNYYKREGKPARRIISIDKLAQGTMAVLLKKPHIARGSPTSVIRNDEHYRSIFSEDEAKHPLAMYGNVVKMLDAVDQYFLSIKSEALRIYRNNLRYHVLMVLSWELNNSSTLPSLRIASLDISRIDNGLVKRVADWVFQQFEIAGAEDRIAKDAKFSKKIQDEWNPGVISATASSDGPS